MDKCKLVQKINYLNSGWGKFVLIAFCQKNCSLIYHSLKNYYGIQVQHKEKVSGTHPGLLDIQFPGPHVPEIDSLGH